MSWKDIFQMSRQVQNFDRLLADQSQYAVTMVGLLKAYVENGSDETKQRQIAEQASDLEHAGDRARITIVEGCGSSRGTIFASYPIDITRNSTIRCAHPRYSREKRMPHHENSIEHLRHPVNLAVW